MRPAAVVPDTDGDVVGVGARLLLPVPDRDAVGVGVVRVVSISVAFLLGVVGSIHAPGLGAGSTSFSEKSGTPELFRKFHGGSLLACCVPARSPRLAGRSPGVAGPEIKQSIEMSMQIH